MSPFAELPCWTIMNCAENRQCPAKDDPDRNCWDIFTEIDVCAFHICRDCIVYLSRQKQSAVSAREMAEIMSAKGIDLPVSTGGRDDTARP